MKFKRNKDDKRENDHLIDAFLNTKISEMVKFISSIRNETNFIKDEINGFEDTSNDIKESVIEMCGRFNNTISEFFDKLHEFGDESTISVWTLIDEFRSIDERISEEVKKYDKLKRCLDQKPEASRASFLLTSIGADIILFSKKLSWIREEVVKKIKEVEKP